MKNLEQLKSKGKVISKGKMKSIGGGYSWLYCAANSVDIKLKDMVILDGSVGGAGDAMTWDECRAKRD